MQVRRAKGKEMQIKCFIKILKLIMPTTKTLAAPLEHWSVVVGSVPGMTGNNVENSHGTKRTIIIIQRVSRIMWEKGKVSISFYLEVPRGDATPTCKRLKDCFL